MKIGIATYAEQPNLLEGDRALASALESLGARAEPLVWNKQNAQERDWDAVVIRSTWDYYRHIADFRRWVEGFRHSSIKLFNSPETIEWNLDKSYLVELSRKGAACVPSLLVKRETPTGEISERIRASGWEEIVLKPCISAGSFLTFRSLPRSPQLERQIEEIRSQADVLVQPYLPSIEREGELSLIFFQGKSPEYSHSVWKRPQEGDFRVQYQHGGKYERLRPSAELVDQAGSLLESIPGEWAYARVDLVDWKNRPLLGEIEVIEPDLYLSYAPEAAERLARAVMHRLNA